MPSTANHTTHCPAPETDLIVMKNELLEIWTNGDTLEARDAWGGESRGGEVCRLDRPQWRERACEWTKACSTRGTQAVDHRRYGLAPRPERSSHRIVSGSYSPEASLIWSGVMPRRDIQDGYGVRLING